MAAAVCARASAGPTYVRRQPEKTALYRLLQQHLLTFEQQWTDPWEGRTLPALVLAELGGFMSCGILARGFAHLCCDECIQHAIGILVTKLHGDYARRGLEVFHAVPRGFACVHLLNLTRCAAYS